MLPVLGNGNNINVPTDVADTGLIVGAWARSTTPQIAWRACAWFGNEIVDLNARLATPIASPNYALGVSETGRIVTAGNGVSYVLQPLPNTVGDTNCDQQVNVTDLLKVIADWGQAFSSADVNADGVVNVHDLMIVVLHWN
jgi:hypothetical protein